MSKLGSIKSVYEHEYASIDICKFIFSICVVAIHTHALEDYSEFFFVKLLNLIIWNAVPFFFMSSGFLIRKKLACSNKAVMLHKIVLMVKKYICLYTICSISYIPLSYRAYSWGRRGRGIILYIKDFIFLGQHKDDWMMWYLLGATYAFIFMYFVVKFELSYYELISTIVVLLLIFLCMDVLSNTGGIDLSTNMLNLYNIMQQTTKGGRILRGCFFIPVGWLYAAKETRPLSMGGV